MIDGRFLEAPSSAKVFPLYPIPSMYILHGLRFVTFVCQYSSQFVVQVVKILCCSHKLQTFTGSIKR